MKTAYFDCVSGISGDMCLGALVHAGADFSELVSQLSTLPVNGYRIFSDYVHKSGFKAVSVKVIPEECHFHRHLKDISDIINGSDLSAEIKEKACAIFNRLAEAEGEVHGIPPEKVHFHEVGAVDAIVDIVGTVICLSLLGVKQIVSSPLPAGRGFVKCAHGLIPVPAPATQMLLKNIPVYGTDIEGELVTPTGAAIISTLAKSFGPYPLMKVEKIGFGAGEKNFEIPNILRVSIGEAQSSMQDEEVEVIETAIDDMNPEIFSHLWERIFTQGALDMYYTPVQMKKGRPGTHVTVLCHAPELEKVLAVIFQETTSLGVRIRREKRICCGRKTVSLITKFGEVTIKIGSYEGAVNYAPEFEDCRKLADKNKVSLKEVYQEAVAAINKIKP